MVYDEAGTTVSITSLRDLRTYVQQNESAEIRRRRGVREYLRALDVCHEFLRLLMFQGKVVGFPLEIQFLDQAYANLLVVEQRRTRWYWSRYVQHQSEKLISLGMLFKPFNWIRLHGSITKISYSWKYSPLLSKVDFLRRVRD